MSNFVFNPPTRILMGPGPSDIHPSVIQAMGKPTVGHLDPLFIELMDDTKHLLRKAFLTENETTFPVSAPGSAGMEMCFANLVEPGEKVLIGVNGVFGERMVENVKRLGGEPIVLEEAWGNAIHATDVEEVLKVKSDINIVAFVHGETSTGVLSNAKEIAEIARKYNCLTVVDTVTSLGGNELRVDDWQLDAVYSGSQKCLSAPPGLSPVTFSNKAMEKIKNRKTLVQSWFLDLNLIMSYWSGEGKRSYHHTAPVHSIYALHQALVLLNDEGLENSWKRHSENHLKLKKGLENLGIEFIVDESERLPQLNAVKFPKGCDEVKVRARLLEEFNIEIGAGLGPLAGEIWRIGLMGHSSSEKNIEYLLSSLKKVL